MKISTQVPYSLLKLLSNEPIIQQCIDQQKYIDQQTTYKKTALCCIVHLLRLKEEDAIPSYYWDGAREVAIFELEKKIYRNLNLDQNKDILTYNDIMSYLKNK